MLKFKESQKEQFKKYINMKVEPNTYENALWKKVDIYAPYFYYIPGIQSICVCNSLSMNTAHKDSDIDLFIITKKNRLWTARIFLTLFLSILGQRKTAQKHAGKFCLSFFISEENLTLESIALKNDIYLYFWIHSLIPIINKNNIFQDFIQKNSSWCEIDNKNINTLRHKKIERYYKKKYFRFMNTLLIFLGDGLEYILKSLFLQRSKKSFQKLGKPFGIIISDTMLKFHNNDQRQIIRDHLNAL